MIEIEKKRFTVPIRTGGYNQKYPWDSMKVGESFFIAGSTVKGRGLYGAAKRMGLKIKTQAVDGGVRVWRIS